MKKDDFFLVFFSFYSSLALMLYANKLKTYPISFNKIKKNPPSMPDLEQFLSSQISLKRLWSKISNTNMTLSFKISEKGFQSKVK